MSVGPVEYMVVAFPGNKFKGEIAPALGDLVDNGTIRIIDLAFVGKDADGNVMGFELEDAGSEVGAAFSAIKHERRGLLNEEDVREVGDALDPNSSAALLVWEDLWATKVRDAIVNAGGELVTIVRVPYEVVDAAIEYAAANAVTASA
jgi:Family of unknown function (DUF6325)